MLHGACACGCGRIVSGLTVWEHVPTHTFYAGPCGAKVRGAVVI